MPHRVVRCSIKIIGLCVLGVLTCLQSVQAEGPLLQAKESFIRAKQYEIFAGLNYFRGDKVSFRTPGVTVEIDDHVAGGFGIGYNFTEHLNYNFEIFFGGSEMDLVAAGSENEVDQTVINFNVNLEYNLFETRFTPLISVGVGFIDTESDDKFPNGFKRGETRVSYGFGAGARWDINDKVFLKTVYRIRWSDLLGSVDEFELHTFNIYVGFKF